MNAVASTSSLQSILPPGPSTFAGCSAATTSNMKQQFAFAQIKGNVCLVQGKLSMLHLQKELTTDFVLQYRIADKVELPPRSWFPT